MALTCLKGRHLVLVGDSITRYVYLVLARFLTTGVWSGDQAFWQLQDKSKRANITEPAYCHENNFAMLAARGEKSTRERSWQVYFERTHDPLGQHEVCDCWRVKCCMENTLVENRYLRVGGAQLTFLTQLGSAGWKPHGHARAGSFDEINASITCAPGSCSGAYSWRLDLAKTYREYVPGLGATELYLQHGHHWSLGGVGSRLAEALLRAARAGAPRVFMGATTHQAKMDPTHANRTAMRHQPLVDTIALALAQKIGIDVVDFTGMTAGAPEIHHRGPRLFYAPDDVHFVCTVYREMALVLLTKLCGDEAAWRLQKQKPHDQR